MKLQPGTRKHELGRPCPISPGAPLQSCYSDPTLSDWPYNACADCTDDKRTIAERLADLADERKED